MFLEIFMYFRDYETGTAAKLPKKIAETFTVC